MYTSHNPLDFDYNKHTQQYQPAVDRMVSDILGHHIADTGEMVHATGQETDTALINGAAIRCDVELARIALALKNAPQFRLWLILHDLARETGRQGFSRAELSTRMRQLHIKNGDTYLRRLVYRGHGEYWELDARTGMIYPTGYVTLSERLTLKAHRHDLHDTYTTNGVGRTKDMYIRIGGAAADFEAAILDAWYASRNNPTIARSTLAALFNRDDRSLRYLEKRAGIQIVSNEAETVDPSHVPLSPNGEVRSDVYRTIDAKGNTLYHYRLPNTYHSNIVKQHDKRGQARRAAYRFRTWIESIELPGNSGQGANHPGKLKQIGRIYCGDRKAAKRSADRGNHNLLHIPDKPGRGSSIVWSVYRTTMYPT